MDHLIALIQQYGLGFVFLNVLALQAGLPLPAYPTLMVAGALAAAGGTPVYRLPRVIVVGSRKLEQARLAREEQATSAQQPRAKAAARNPG